jgi:zinc transporter ZupT
VLPLPLVNVHFPCAVYFLVVSRSFQIEKIIAAHEKKVTPVHEKKVHEKKNQTRP